MVHCKLKYVIQVYALYLQTLLKIMNEKTLTSLLIRFKKKLIQFYKLICHYYVMVPSQIPSAHPTPELLNGEPKDSLRISVSLKNTKHDSSQGDKW